MILFSGHLRHAGCRRHQAYGLCRGAREEYFLSDGRERRRTPDGRGVPPGLPAGRRALENVGAKCCPVTKHSNMNNNKKMKLFWRPDHSPFIWRQRAMCLSFFQQKQWTKSFCVVSTFTVKFQNHFYTTVFQFQL